MARHFLRLKLTLLRNGLLLTGVKGDATVVVIGLVLILAVLINNLVRKQEQ